MAKELILILGEGNFSFTVALLEKSHSNGHQFFIYSTSFDSYEEVEKKYPESRSLFKKITESINVKLLHEVNATVSLKQTLLREKCDVNVFEHVVFNFPHLGVEDAAMHKRMIAHIFYR